jgi:hypothetical protein
MERSPMIKKFEREQNKKNSLLKEIVTIAVVPLIIGSGIAWGIGKYLQKQEKEIEYAFAGNCGIERKIDLKYYGNFEAEPYIIAREQFQELRKKFPERFEKISNKEGTEYLRENNYNPSTKKLSIPNYDCK